MATLAEMKRGHSVRPHQLCGQDAAPDPASSVQADIESLVPQRVVRVACPPTVSSLTGTGRSFSLGSNSHTRPTVGPICERLEIIEVALGAAAHGSAPARTPEMLADTFVPIGPAWIRR